MERKGFFCFNSYLDALAPLNDAERGRLFTHCLIYSSGGGDGHLSGNERYIWPMMKAQIDRDWEKAQSNSKKRSEAAMQKHANAANACKCSMSMQKGTKDKNKNKDKDQNQDKESAPLTPQRGERARFARPTVEQVGEYCLERSNGIDPQRFCDYYEANGWKVGKNPMKDWKAAVRTWEKRSQAASGNPFLRMLEGER